MAVDFVWTSDVETNDSISIASVHELFHPPKSTYNPYYTAPLAKIGFFSFSLDTVTKRYNTAPQKTVGFQLFDRTKT